MRKLKNKSIILFLTAICFALIIQASFAFGDAIHFDADGSIIDKIHYETIVSEWDKEVRLKLKNGYGPESTWKDPILLRQERIFQWQMWHIMRLLYDPDSLPEKNERFQAKTNDNNTQ